MFCADKRNPSLVLVLTSQPRWSIEIMSSYWERLIAFHFVCVVPLQSDDNLCHTQVKMILFFPNRRIVALKYPYVCAEVRYEANHVSSPWSKKVLWGQRRSRAGKKKKERRSHFRFNKTAFRVSTYTATASDRTQRSNRSNSTRPRGPAAEP